MSVTKPKEQMMNSHSNVKITMIINYAGLQLPVYKSSIGEDITPLKPIVDLFGLVWRDQRAKIMGNDFYRNHLGIYEQPRNINQVRLSSPADEVNLTSNTISEGDNPTYLPEVFIRIDRIASYFMTINPERVRANGNITGADFLQQKIEEWADALHDYESLGVAFKDKNKHINNELMQIMKMRQMAIGQEKLVFSKMLQSKLVEFGYQADDRQGDLFT